MQRYTVCADVISVCDFYISLREMSLNVVDKTYRYKSLQSFSVSCQTNEHQRDRYDSYVISNERANGRATEPEWDWVNASVCHPLCECNSSECCSCAQRSMKFIWPRKDFLTRLFFSSSYTQIGLHSIFLFLVSKHYSHTHTHTQRAIQRAFAKIYAQTKVECKRWKCHGN